MSGDFLKKYTWFKTGGRANQILKVNSIEDLQSFLSDNQEPYYVLGAASNVMMDDRGFNGTIIRTTFLRRIKKLNECYIEAEAGISDLNLSNFAAKNHITGFEFLCSIPGTVGGAIRMNAGCFGKEIKDLVVSVKCLKEKGDIIDLNKEECGFVYRGSAIPKNWIVVSAIFKGDRGCEEQIFADMNKMFLEKEKSQPIGVPSVGSVFKNPLPRSAWQVVDEAGFRGYKYKSVMVSEKHTNFIVHNPEYEGEVSSKDFLELVELIKSQVLEKLGILLVLEVKVIDYNNSF